MKVNREALQAALSKLRDIVDDKNPVTAYRFVCVRNSLGMGYDGHSSGIVTHVPLPGLEFCAPLEKLYPVVKEATTDELEVTMPGNNLILKCPGLHVKIGTSDVDHFPNFFPSVQNVDRVATDFSQAIANTLISCDETGKQGVCGVGVAGDQAYSCDGNRITRAKFGSSFQREFVLPAVAAKRIVRLGTTTAAMLVKSSLVVAFTDGTWLVCPSLSAKFPFNAIEGEMARPTRPEYELELPDGLGKSLDLLALFSDDERSVVLECNGGLLSLDTSKDTDEARSEFQTDFKHDFRIRLNFRYLRDILKKTRRVNLTSVFTMDQARTIKFKGDGYDHLLALMT